jgi:hypothetical protein
LWDFTVSEEANMGTKELILNITSLLLGGMAVAVFTWWKEARSANRQREIVTIQDQLRLLYGPLHCLTVQNMEIIKLMVKLQGTLNQNIWGLMNKQSRRPVVSQFEIRNWH